MDPTFFDSAASFRAWLAGHGEDAAVLLVGFRTAASGRGGLTDREALDEALCAGWIDGVRRRIDASAYVIRFTPRRPRSRWSEVNVRRAGELIGSGRMTAAGLAAFEARDPAKTGESSSEARSRPLASSYDAELRAVPAAAAFWDAQPPSYRRTAAWFVMSARREATQRRRLALLIEDSARGRRLAAVTLRGPEPLERPERPGRPGRPGDQGRLERPGHQARPVRPDPGI